MTHGEPHYTKNMGWLRAAVLGANDGLLSTSSLIVGVASADNHANILLVGIAGLFAGALAMAAGEYVSVSSQADTERADIAREKKELEINWAGELVELADIYSRRGLEPALAREVATQLMAHDALGAHVRDELGLSEALSARPLQAAFASACSFAAGAAAPLLAVVFVTSNYIVLSVASASIVSLIILGGLSANIGGAPTLRACLRMTFWGAFAMVVTAVIGKIFGTAV